MIISARLLLVSLALAAVGIVVLFVTFQYHGPELIPASGSEPEVAAIHASQMRMAQAADQRLIRAMPFYRFGLICLFIAGLSIGVSMLWAILGIIWDRLFQAANP